MSRTAAVFRFVFRDGSRTLGEMSLNRYEQRVFDYLQGHPEERHHWQQKFRSASKEFADEHVAVMKLEAELWRYYQERSTVVPMFKDAARHEGMARISLRNLAELLLRLWTDPRPKKKTADTEHL